MQSKLVSERLLAVVCLLLCGLATFGCASPKAAIQEKPVTVVAPQTVIVPQTVLAPQTVIVPQTIIVEQTVIVTVTPRPATAVPVAEDAQKMEEALTVKLTGIKPLPIDSDVERYSPAVNFAFEFINNSDKDIRAFTGVLAFADVFDQPKKRVNLTHDEVVPAHTSVVTKDYGIDINQFMDNDMWLFGTALENVHFSFTPKSIIFADGTKLGAVN